MQVVVFLQFVELFSLLPYLSRSDFCLSERVHVSLIPGFSPVQQIKLVLVNETICCHSVGISVLKLVPELINSALDSIGVHPVAFIAHVDSGGSVLKQSLFIYKRWPAH